MSRRTPQSVKNSCDDLWGKVVKARAGGRCEHCGQQPPNAYAYHAHHVWGRTDHRLRFEIRNGVALCWTCHRWAEEMPIEFTYWMEEYRPNDLPFLIEERAKGQIKRLMTDWLALEAELKTLLKETR